MKRIILLGIVLLACYAGLVVHVVHSSGVASFATLLGIGGDPDTSLLVGHGGYTESLFYISFVTPRNTPATMRIIDITQDAVELAWISNDENDDCSLRYELGAFPSDPTDGTHAYTGGITSARVEQLESGKTYYFALWATYDGVFSENATYCVATTGAGFPDPDYGDAIGPDTDSTKLDDSVFGGFIDFISAYAELPRGTVGILGYGSLFVFGLVAMAVYNRSVFAILIFAVAGLALGNSLGVFATVFLVIAVIIGITVGHIRGGQPTGG